MGVTPFLGPPVLTCLKAEITGVIRERGRPPPPHPQEKGPGLAWSLVRKGQGTGEVVSRRFLPSSGGGGNKSWNS